METINYKEIIKKYPWIISPGQECILSPDADGFLSGLLMSSFLGWKIVGFYDGKVLLKDRSLDINNVVFLDMEILRPGVKSIGHHMNVHNFRTDQSIIEKMFNETINPNYIRGFDRCHNFRQKYPLGTIHLLLFILDSKNINVKINPEGLGAIFFADGTWKVLFNYTQNVFDWLKYLDAKHDKGWIRELQSISVIKLIEELESLFNQMAQIHPNNKRWYGHIDLYQYYENHNLMIKFLELLSSNLGWNFDYDLWKLNNLEKFEMQKKIATARGEMGFRDVLAEGPISLAMTNSNDIQYTVDNIGLFKSV